MSAGFGRLVRLILRRDRFLLAVWVLVMSVLPAGIASATRRAYPTAADMAVFTEGALGNPAELATRGPIFAPTTGSLTAWTFGSSGVLVGGVVSLLLVIRHTRADEVAGRRELLGSGVVGRHAPLAAALAVVAGGNVVIALLAALGLAANGLAPAGGIALGLVIGAGSTLFAAVGALTAQLAEGAGAARGLAFVVLGALFAVAAVGEVGRSGLVWASPFGWARRMQAFAGEQWWVLLLFAVGIAGLTAAAFAVSARRDVGAGVLPVRLGPAVADWTLRSPLALSWRLQRAAVLAWSGGNLALGLLLGAAMGQLGSQLDTPAFRELTASLGGGAPADVFFRFVLYVLAQVGAASTIAAALRLRAQETEGTADALLAGPVGRVRWALAHLAVTALGTVAVLAALGLGAGLGYGEPLAVLGTTLAYVPACLALAAVGVALYGWLPRLAVPVTWAVLAITLLLDLLGEFRLVDRAVVGISPFVQTLEPLTTGSGLAVALAGLVAAAGLLGAAGLAGLTRRDLG